MPKMNGPGFRSLLEERVAEVFRGYGVGARPGGPDSGADLIVTIPTTDGPQELTVEVKSAITVGGTRRRRCAVSAHEYVSPSMAASYRDQDMFYLDVLGNAYIALPGFRLDVQGRRMPKASDLKQLKPHRAFGYAGAKLVFAMLAMPEVVGWTVRDLADLGRVSTGTVNNTVQDLARNGFLVPSPSGRRLRRTERLAELWMSSYLTRILPKLEEVSLAGPEAQWWNPSNLPEGALLGGGVALTTLGFDIVPAAALVYGQPPWGSIRKAGRLNREGQPNVTLREQFWDSRLNSSASVVPPLLVYADAMASDDPRQLDAAAELWEQNDELRRLRALS